MGKRKGKKKSNGLAIALFIVAIIFLLAGFLLSDENKKELLRIKNQQALARTEKDIKAHYSNLVMVNTDAKIYTYDNDEYVEAGMIKKNEVIALEEKEVTYEDKYFKIQELENYYINYKSVKPTNEKPTYSDRYKKYIPFNENVVTNDKVSFYDDDREVVYTFNKSFSLPIIIKYGEDYGVIYNERMLTIKKEDVKEVIKSDNTKLANTGAIAVLNYHFFYDGNSKEDTSKCNQGICLSTQNLKKHLDYIKNNNIFTPTMKELEMYIDKKIRLPKSVVLTIDDGWRAEIGSNIMAEYGLNATVFLISKEHPKSKYENDYIEVHSHGHNIHNKGACPTGQGGGIQCLPKATLLADLKTSREKLNNTTVFCYPFYEYNNYSIEVLKEAGFTMAFGGPNENGKARVVPGIDKFRLPRYVIWNNTNVNNIKSYIG